MTPPAPEIIQMYGLPRGWRGLLAVLLVGGLSFLCSGARQHAAAAANVPGMTVPTLSWQMMRGLDYRTGEMTTELQALINGMTRVPGYMVPLEDDLQEVTEFLLVPYPGACIHVPPPPANQIVHVIMAGDKKAQVRLWMEPVWVEGALKLAEATTRDGVLSYFQLTATLIQSYQEGK